MRIEQHNLHGTGDKPCKVYDVKSRSPCDFWESVTDIPCPVKGCTNTVLWYEAGYVPRYRVCMQPISANVFDHESIRHRFLAAGDAKTPQLILDEG